MTNLLCPGAMKTFAFLSPKRDISLDEFHDHWRHPHGTLAQHITSFIRYVQAHRIDVPGVPGLGGPHHGAAEMWFRDEQAAIALADERVYVESVVPDEENFIQLDQTSFRVVTEEHALTDDRFDPTSTSVKLLHCARRRGDVSLDDFHAALTGPHEERLGERLGADRHVVCTALPENYGDEFVPYDGVHHAWLTSDPYDVVRELWWSDTSALTAAIEHDPDAWRDLLSGGLVDAARSVAFVADEYIVVADAVSQ